MEYDRGMWENVRNRKKIIYNKTALKNTKNKRFSNEYIETEQNFLLITKKGGMMISGRSNCKQRGEKPVTGKENEKDENATNDEWENIHHYYEGFDYGL